MRAYVLDGIDQLHLKEVAVPVIQKGEVLVQVKAAGICGSDIPRIFKTGTYHFPTIPGHEFSGKVVKAENPEWMEKRVGIFPLIPCHSCEPCKKKQYEMCRNYSYLGSRTDGGFAEYVVVPEDNLIELPESVSYEEAAMLEPMAVAVHAMRQAGIRPEQNIAICGLGTIGMFLLMFFKEAGCKNLYVIGNKEFQKRKVADMGIAEDSYCDSRICDPEEWLKEKTNGTGVDVFFECVGKNETIAQAIRLTVPGGTVSLVGNPATDIAFEKDTYWKILRNQLTVKGNWNSSFTHEDEDDWHYVIERLADGRIQPEQYITQRLPFDELEKGLHIMRDKSEDYLKVMIIWQM